MRVSLIYPPDHKIPHSLALSLAELAGSLRAAGREVVIRDLNAEVLNTLLNKKILESYRDYMEKTTAEFRRKTELSGPETVMKHFMENCLSMPLDLAMEGEAAARTLYDPERFYDPKEYRLAMDRLVAALGFLFGSIGGPSPYAPDYLPQMQQILRLEHDDPVIRALKMGLLDSVIVEEPDLIGITIPFQEQLFEGLRIAAMLKRMEPNLKIAIGGPQVTKYQHEMFADATLFEFIDYACVNEGNSAIVEMVEAIEGKRANKEVRNTYWAENGEIRFNGVSPNENMSALPSPSYIGAKLDAHLKPEPLFGLMTTRGCAYKICTFCSEAFHSNFAMRSTDRVFEDVKRLVTESGAKHIFFWDSLMPPRSMWELADKIAEAKLDVTWFCNTKFYDLFADPVQAKRLYDGGLRSIHFGMESANQRILDLMKKGTKIVKVPAILKTLRQAGIMTQCSWFGGFPTETREEFDETVQFLQDNKQHLSLDVFVGSYYFEFGTYVSQHPEEFDGEIVDIGGDYAFECKSGMRQDEIQMLREHYLQNSDMDLLCHGGYYLYHVNKQVSPHVISRQKLRPLPPPGSVDAGRRQEVRAGW